MPKQLQRVLILLIFTSCTILTYSCDTTYTFDNSMCVFNMDYGNDSTCHNFQFMNCSYQKCLEWSDSEDESYYCVNKQYSSQSWSGCTNQCCSTIFSDTNIDAIKQCQNYINQAQRKRQKQKIIDIIIASCVLGTIFVVIPVIIALCIIRNKICTCLSDFIHCRCFLGFSQNASISDGHSRPQLDSSNFILGEISKWKQIQQSKSPPYLNMCSVCLEDGCYFELHCQHLFHLECILACIDRKPECILCRSTSLQTARTYCRKCFKCYLNVSIQPLRRLSRNYIELICPQCSLNMQRIQMIE